MSHPDETKSAPSEARLRANRLNAQNSKGPTSVEGKKRSCLNATRHGILSQTIHFPEEEMTAYSEFCERYVAGLKPVGVLETELANACADLQRKALARTDATQGTLPDCRQPSGRD